MKKFILLMLVFVSVSCTQHTCPTYSETAEQTPSLDSLKMEYAAFVAKDSTEYKPTVLEKTGMVLFTVFVFHQMTSY